MSFRGKLSGEFPPPTPPRFADRPGLTRVRSSHPPGATNLPVFVSGPGGMEPNFDEFARGVEAAFPDKEANFVVGCRSGVRVGRGRRRGGGMPRPTPGLTDRPARRRCGP